MKKTIILTFVMMFFLVSLANTAFAAYTAFFNEFEDSSGTGTTGFNFTIWSTEQGDGNDVQVSTAHVYGGNYAASLNGEGATGEAATGEAALSINDTYLNMTGYSTCTLRYWFFIGGNQESNDHMYVDIYDGSWNYAVDDVVGEDYDSGSAAWRERTVSLSSYNMVNGFRVRFDAESNADNEEYYVDTINITCDGYNGYSPSINNITASHSTIKGGNTITVYANTTTHGVNDTDQATLYLYCDSTNTPTAANTDCTGGTTSDADYPYILTCTFAAPSDTTNHTEHCRIYDTLYYSTAVNITYETDSTAPTTAVISVAGDTTATYYDATDDSRTDIIIGGEGNMSCRWASSDLAYSSMSNACTITNSQANCSVTDVLTQGLNTMYVSCQDVQVNEQTVDTNLNVQFYLDYTAPITTDSSSEAVQVPDYSVTITEADNVDSDPVTYYCKDTANSCTPTTLIDDGGQATYTSLNRGLNYIRYYSTDDAGNTQTTISKTININQLPVLISATDDATTIKGGTTINVSTVSSDADSQTLTLFVCNSTEADSNGCTSGHYCNATGTANVSCTFTSESDSTSHTWYVFIFDSLGEAASNNPLSGSYTTDTTAPVITIIEPDNTTYVAENITVEINLNEDGDWAGYCVDSCTSNTTMTNVSTTYWTATTTALSDGEHYIRFYANDTYGNM